MRESAPAQLVALLESIGLATARDFENVEAAVHRMAGDLPRFDSVWIDALRQARVLTQFQAASLHAGRGETLRVAHFVLGQIVHECGYASIYRAEDLQTHEWVRLAVFSAPDQDSQALLTEIEKLASLGKTLSQFAGIIDASGRHGSRCWAASAWVDGTSLADLLLRHSRFPPEVVLEAARAMLGQLCILDTAGVIHGDIRAENVLVARDGEIHIPHAGLRGLIHPYEGVSHLDVVPEACSTLAPERVTDGTPPNVASDLFACGCVWWQMLCGRPPLGGGDNLARLQAAQAVAIDDLHQWASDVPGPLVELINECLHKLPERRPASMAEAAQRLGPPTSRGSQAIARYIASAARPRAPWLRSKRAQGKRRANPHRFTIATVVLLAVVAVAWPLWVARNQPQAKLADPHNHGRPEGQAKDMFRGADRFPRASEPSQSHSSREPIAHPMVDAAVAPAGYVGAVPAGPISDPSFNHEEDLRLPTDRPIRGEVLALKAGMRVHAQGGRARVIVPRDGLTVEADRVSFENVDFVTDERPNTASGRDVATSALVHLLAAECAFTGCSFQSADGRPDLRPAIFWDYASSPRSAAVALPSGRVRMSNCVLRRVGAGLESRVRGAVAVEMANVLYLGPGPMICLARAPAADEPVRINLAQVTVREAEALLACRCLDPGEPAGEIHIEAAGCVLAPREAASLLVITSDVFPGRLWREVKWTGQGSVLAGPTVFGRWRRRDGSEQTVDDSTVSISGLVRGTVDFAAKCTGEPASSQIVNCTAPLQDSESAGAATRGLPPEPR